MSIVKRGEIASSLIVVSLSYICNKCGYILAEKESLEGNSRCKKCQDGIMILSSAESTVKE